MNPSQASATSQDGAAATTYAGTMGASSVATARHSSLLGLLTFGGGEEAVRSWVRLPVELRVSMRVSMRATRCVSSRAHAVVVFQVSPLAGAVASAQPGERYLMVELMAAPCGRARVLWGCPRRASAAITSYLSPALVSNANAHNPRSRRLLKIGAQPCKGRLRPASCLLACNHAVRFPSQPPLLIGLLAPLLAGGARGRAWT